MNKNVIILLIIILVLLVYLYCRKKEYMKENTTIYSNEIKLVEDAYKNKEERKEKIVRDALGDMTVPYNVYYGGMTAKYLKYFKNDFEPKIPIKLIKSYAILKRCAAHVNTQHKFINNYQANKIIEVCDEILDNKLDGNFPLTVWQTGSGTTTNMNVNEVISNRANEITINNKIKLTDDTFVHQNDHVNKSQSSNDSFPSTLHIYFVLKIIIELQPILQKIIYCFHKKEEEFKDNLKLGRTHLQDAVPMTFGQEFSGYRTLLENNFRSILESLNSLYEIPLGGTAVGTGTNSFPQFGKEFCDELNNYINKRINYDYKNFVKTNLINEHTPENIFENKIKTVKFISAPNKFAAISANNSLMILSSALKELGINLYKIANDIRLLASGPRTGLAEIIIPQNEPGSSIMPGKVNPTQAEVIVMIAINIIGNDMAISFAGSQGQFEMNVCRPLMFYKLNENIETLVYFLNNFTDFLVSGIKINNEKIKYYLKNSLSIGTLLNNYIGYDKVSEMVHYALKHNLSFEEVCIKYGYKDLYDKHIGKYIK